MGDVERDLGGLNQGVAVSTDGRSAALRAEPLAASQAEPAATNANGPDLWNAILARMPAGAVIAGGAVRDYLLGIEPRDIDVFMGEYAGTCEETGPADILDDLAVIDADPRCGLFRIDNEHERFAEYAAVSNILCVSSGTLLGVKVDAVLIDKFEGGEALIRDFDFGITRCWFDGEIHDTPQAKRDRESRQITLLSTEREQRSLARFERLNERWGGGWKLVRAASAETHPQGGDGEAAPFMSGAVGAAETPNLNLDTPHDQ